jgi:predicted anti-sigma-YlaC factor YlaD
MRLISFYDWIRRIYATQDDELDCDEVEELLPAYIDCEIAGQVPPPHLAGVEHHLLQCAYCHDLYLAVREAALLEAESELEAVPVECSHRA